jgi:type II secretory pathway pseudopilin PulG
LDLLRLPRSNDRARPGLTLIELLVALVLTIMIIGATFMIYQTNSRYYYRQQARLEQAQNLRSALYTLARDLRMAGDGLIVMGVPLVHAYLPEPDGTGGAWFRYEVDGSGALAGDPGLRAIFGLDATDGPDSITVFRSEVESSNAFGQLDEPFLSTSSNLILASPVPERSVSEGDVLGLVSGRDAVLVKAGTISGPGADGKITLDAALKPGSSFPSSLSFPRGSFVYNLRDVHLTTYWVDTANRNLMARYHHLAGLDYDDPVKSSIIVAPGIEDLQLRYVMNGQDPDDGVDGLTLAILEADNWVRQIQIGLVSRSEYRDPTNSTFMPVSMFNHVVSEPADGHMRQVQTGGVNLRNY